MTDDRRGLFNAQQNLPERDIVTSAELKTLKDLREEPEPALTLEPQSVARFRADYELHRLRERRIAYLEARLHVADVGMRRDMDKAFDPER